MRDTPPGVQILSLSCSFGKIWQNHMLAPPPRQNPGSVTANGCVRKVRLSSKVVKPKLLSVKALAAADADPGFPKGVPTRKEGVEAANLLFG